jgi:hypothetical protein
MADAALELARSLLVGKYRFSSASWDDDPAVRNPKEKSFP